jgi:DNA-binding PadR family transcriptional regulator
MREIVLAMIDAGSSYGYEIKQSLESRFGDLLPEINAGQVYTTLARLERDGLISGEAIAGDSRGKRVFELTPAGRSALREWVETPGRRPQLRDEFLIEFLVAADTGLADPRDLIDRQRMAYLQSLRDLDGPITERATTLAAALLVEGAILHVKADLEWLDLIEQHF